MNKKAGCSAWLSLVASLCAQVNSQYFKKGRKRFLLPETMVLCTQHVIMLKQDKATAKYKYPVGISHFASGF